MADFYELPSVSIVAGSTTALVTGIILADIVREDDELVAEGRSARILSVAESTGDNWVITIKEEWPGETLVDTIGYIRVKPDSARFTEEVTEFLALLQQLGLWIPTEGIPDNLIGKDGDWAFDPDTEIFYEKVEGEWEQRGTLVAPEWLSGPGIPDPELGKDGDLYLRTSNGDLYQKSSDSPVWAIITNIKGPQGNTGSTGPSGPSGVSGASALTRVRVVATANVAISTGLENGDTLNGVTLVTNDLVLLPAQTAPAENGVYVVPASGAAARHADFDTYDELPGSYFSVMEGTAKSDTLWRCTSDKGGTLGSTAIVISEFTSGSGSVPRGYIYGLTLSNNGSDPTNDIDITAGEAASSSSTPTLMTLVSPMTKQLDAVWAPGTNQGMRASGAAITDTTYHLFEIKRPDTGVVDIAADTSASGANIAANTNAAYTEIRRIGSIIRSSGAILGFSQKGDRFDLSTAVTARSASTAFALGLLTLAGVPTGIVVRPIMRLRLISTGSSTLTHSLGSAGASSGEVQIIFLNVTSATYDVFEQFFTNTSAQIQFECAIHAGTLNSSVINVLGWIDDRGRTS